MSGVVTDVGQYQPLTRKFARALASAAIVGTLALGLWTFADTSSIAGGETRTISLYHIHTKERLTVTYMQNGRYVPSAMKKVNYLLRDWRRNEVITIDPRTIDVMWEMHADLGSRRPINIVCGYRSPKTNAFLKRIGRKVAGKSQHMKGKAIDFFFPDVPTMKIRNTALARNVGGVGYYRSSAGPTGFLHADTGNKRYWGPGIGRSQMASALREGNKVIGKRLGRRGAAVQVASAEPETPEKKSGGILGFFTKGKKQPASETVAQVANEPNEPALETAYEADDDELANLSADAAVAAKSAPTPVDITPLDAAMVDVNQPSKVAEPEFVPANAEFAALASSASVDSESDDAVVGTGFQTPTPQLRHKAVLAMAIARATSDEDVTIQPASAEPAVQTWLKKPSPIADSLGPVEAAETLIEEAPASNLDGKTSFAAELRDGTAEDVVVIQPVIAALETKEPAWWTMFYSSAEAALRRDGVPMAMDDASADVMPVAAILGPDGTGPVASSQQVADGKGDPLFVNREGKTGLPSTKLRLSSRSDTTAE